MINSHVQTPKEKSYQTDKIKCDTRKLEWCFVAKKVQIFKKKCDI